MAYKTLVEKVDQDTAIAQVTVAGADDHDVSTPDVDILMLEQLLNSGRRTGQPQAGPVQ